MESRCGVARCMGPGKEDVCMSHAVGNGKVGWGEEMKGSCGIAVSSGLNLNRNGIHGLCRPTPIFAFQDDN